MNRGEFGDLTPLLRRALELDPAAVIRVRRAGGAATAFLRVPFGVLVSRTVTTGEVCSVPRDEAFRAAELLNWLEAGPDAPPPRPDDLLWRRALPPPDGWRRVEQVPDGEIRRVVKAAALALRDAALRAGLPKGAQPPREVADAVLDAVGLRVDGGGVSAEVSVRALSALTRMGFLARDSVAFVDVAAGWARVVGRYGNVYVERGALSLSAARGGAGPGT